MVGLSTRLLTEARLQQDVSPQLIVQSQILELNADDLHERVREELEDNPALEMVDDACLLPFPPPITVTGAAPDEALERLCSPSTLADDLRLQLSRVPGVRRDLCHYLIECLDERGFLDVDTMELPGQWGVSSAEAQAAIAALQSLEPAGIGARNLCECLLLQMRRLSEDEVPARAADFIRTFLKPAAKGSPLRTAGALGLSDEGLAEIIQFIAARLYMWPADRFRADGDHAHQAALLPDAWIVWDGEELRVRVVQSWSRNLQVSEAWARLDRQMRQTGADALAPGETVAERIRRARAFIDHLARREAMLHRVTEAIVTQQREFFDNGSQALVPLTRKQIAADLQVHESTVSRITSDKYVQLPNGVLVAYDFFFDNSLSAKALLRSLIEREDSRRPLSDAALAERLQSAGYPLARRTVAKYRDQLEIPSAHLRRQALRLSS
jgi:RNA polymerase sigma-54 factor